MNANLSAILLALALPTLVAAQADMPAVFVTNNVGDSVTSFTLNADGSLNYVGTFPAGDGPQSISLTPDGRFLAVTHGTASNSVEEVIIYAVNSDATLTQLLLTTTPDSPLDCQWLSNTVLAVTKTDLSDNNYVITYAWNDIPPTLTQVDMGYTGTFNTSLSVTRGGSLVLANDSFGDFIWSYTADEMGNLSLNESQSTAPIFAVAVTASPDGNFVYGAGGISGTGHEIIAYSIDETGLLTPIAGAQSPGQSPKVIGITDDGSVLVAGHGTDATVRSFIRDPKTGTITPTGFSFDVGSQGNLGDLIVMDDMMFVTDESISDDGVRGLYSFRINANGSFTQLGPIVDTTGGRPEYIAAWPGQPALPLLVAPDSWVIYRGVLVDGDFPDTLETDDQYAKLIPGFTLNSNEYPVWLYFNGMLPLNEPDSLSVIVESQAGTPGLTVTVEALNWNTNQLEMIGSFAESFNVDTVETIDISAGITDYVAPESGDVQVRIGWKKTGPTINYPWEVRLDQIGWLFVE